MNLSQNLSIAAVLSAVVAQVGCGLASSSVEFQGGGANADAGPVLRDDPNSTGSSGGTPPEGTSKLAALTPEVILVHASRDLPAMRLCLADDGDEPIPANNIMPRTNQVGVDVGGAAYLGDLSNPKAGTKAVKPGTTAYLFRADITERRNTVTGAPQRHQACSFYIKEHKEFFDYWKVTIPEKLTKNALLVITGNAFSSPAPSLVAVDLEKTSASRFGGLFVSLTDDVKGNGFHLSVDDAGGSMGLPLEKETIILPYEPTHLKDVAWTTRTNDAALVTRLSLWQSDEEIFGKSMSDLAQSVDTSMEAERYFRDPRTIVIALGEKSGKDDHAQRRLHLLAVPAQNPAIDLPPPGSDGGGIPAQ